MSPEEKVLVKFLKNIKENGTLTAFKILDGENSKEITFLQYYEEIEKCAYNLEKIVGNLKGKRIGIYCDSSYEYTILVCAIIFGRATAVPLNIRESLDNIVYEIENTELDAIIIDNDRLQSNDGILEIQKEDVLSDEMGKADLKDFSEDEENIPSLIIYTSGTTGKPKGVVISAGNLFKYPKSMYDSNVQFAKTEGLKIYTNFPFYHIGGITSWITHFEEGCSTYLSVKTGNVLDDLKNESIDSAVVTPATLKLWKKAISRGHIERLGGAKLVVSAGAPVDIDTLDVFMQNGISYGQYYGMSESCGNISLNFDCKEHLKSVGRPAPMVDIIIDDGEICVKGPGVMKGYYNNEEETKEVLVGGVLHTGDLGYIDDDGYLYITGRKKNLIILSGGENVSPEELEKLLYKNGDIKECKVFEKNDRIRAAVYADESARDSIKEYISELNKTLPIYKRIYGTDFQNVEFEKTASGKIKR